MSFDGQGTDNGTFEYGTFTGSFDPRCFAETCLFVPQLGVFSGSHDDAEQADQPDTDNLPLPAEMLTLFEQITGWIVAVDETPSGSKPQRQFEAESSASSGSEADVQTVLQTTGQSAHRSAAPIELATRDISANWPAGRPTGHRAKCDQFLGLLGKLVSQLHVAQVELTRAQSSLAAIDPTTFSDDDKAILIDSFIPQWTSESNADRRNGDRRNADQRNGDQRNGDQRIAERRITVSRRSSSQASSQSEEDFVLIDFNESIDLDILIELNKLKTEIE